MSATIGYRKSSQAKPIYLAIVAGLACAFAIAKAAAARDGQRFPRLPRHYAR